MFLLLISIDCIRLDLLCRTTSVEKLIPANSLTLGTYSAIIDLSITYISVVCFSLYIGLVVRKHDLVVS